MILTNAALVSRINATNTLLSSRIAQNTTDITAVSGQVQNVYGSNYVSRTELGATNTVLVAQINATNTALHGIIDSTNTVLSGRIDGNDTDISNLYSSNYTARAELAATNTILSGRITANTTDITAVSNQVQSHGISNTLAISIDAGAQAISNLTLLKAQGAGIDLVNRYLKASDTITTLDWTSGFLQDVTGTKAADWFNRTLYSTNGTDAALDWAIDDTVRIYNDIVATNGTLYGKTIDITQAGGGLQTGTNRMQHTLGGSGSLLMYNNANYMAFLGNGNPTPEDAGDFEVSCTTDNLVGTKIANYFYTVSTYLVSWFGGSALVADIDNGGAEALRICTGPDYSTAIADTPRIYVTNTTANMGFHTKSPLAHLHMVSTNEIILDSIDGITVKGKQIKDVPWPTAGTNAVNRDYVDAGDAAGNILEYWYGSVSNAGDPELYYKMTNAVSSATVNTNTIAATPTNNQYLAAFIANSNIISEIKAGTIINVHYHARRTGNPASVLQVKPELYIREADGSETNEIESGESDAWGETDTAITTHISITNDLVLGTTARLVVKLKVTSVSGTTGGEIYTEGNAAARIQVPIVGGNFVNKNGDTMLGALDMGGNKITTLATPTAATDAATKAYADAVTNVGIQFATNVAAAYAPTAGQVLRFRNGQWSNETTSASASAAFKFGLTADQANLVNNANTIINVTNTLIDTESGLDHANQRYIMPSTGKWVIGSNVRFLAVDSGKRCSTFVRYSPDGGATTNIPYFGEQWQGGPDADQEIIVVFSVVIDVTNTSSFVQLWCTSKNGDNTVDIDMSVGAGTQSTTFWGVKIGD